MVLKVHPRRNCNFDCDRVQTYWPKQFEKIQDPCKDACGKWKKFRVKVTKECPICITLLNLGDEGIEGYTIHQVNKCDTYKPMKPIAFNNEESCDVILLKPGAYEFRPINGEVFSDLFSWTTTEISDERLANMISIGGQHAVF